MSPTYFCRFFKKVTHHSLTDYLSRLRVERAKELLLRGGLSVTEVSMATGFESHSYFDRVFRRYAHESPREFLSRAGSPGADWPDR